MLKVRLLLAAVLAGLMAPTAAMAAPSETLKMVLQARKENFERRAELRQKLASGEGDADYLRGRLDAINARIARQNNRIEKLKEGQASN